LGGGIPPRAHSAGLAGLGGDDITVGADLCVCPYLDGHAGWIEIIGAITWDRPYDVFGRKECLSSKGFYVWHDRQVYRQRELCPNEKNRVIVRSAAT
jgi:hypothetical protein